MINQRFHKPTITKDGASLFDDSWLEAKEDILVFKDLAHYGFRCVTPYRQMLVKFVDGKFVYGEIKLGIDNKLEIVKEGAHAYVLDWYCNHLAVIPKGSKFFVGYDMDIVSNNLIVYEKVVYSHKEIDQYKMAITFDEYKKKYLENS